MHITRDDELCFPLSRGASYARSNYVATISLSSSMANNNNNKREYIQYTEAFAESDARLAFSSLRRAQAFIYTYVLHGAS